MTCFADIPVRQLNLDTAAGPLALDGSCGRLDRIAADIAVRTGLPVHSDGALAGYWFRRD